MKKHLWSITLCTMISLFANEKQESKSNPHIMQQIKVATESIEHIIDKSDHPRKKGILGSCLSAWYQSILAPIAPSHETPKKNFLLCLKKGGIKLSAKDEQSLDKHITTLHNIIEQEQRTLEANQK